VAQPTKPTTDTTWVSVRFPNDLADSLRERARLEDRSLSAHLRHVARRSLDDRKTTTRVTR
jgi:hypothetical protein